MHTYIIPGLLLMLCDMEFTPEQIGLDSCGFHCARKDKRFREPHLTMES